MNEAELLFTHVLNCDRASLYLERDARLPHHALAFISSVLKRRIEGEPLQYVLGRTEFMGLEFLAQPGVFIPRPETEILVEAAIKRFFLPRPGHSALTILDVCTGSGCIAVSLAKFLPQADVFAFDVSEEALDIARRNARAHGVRITYVLSDLFRGLAKNPCLFDGIVSNPPYIPTREIKHLPAEVRHEPHSALDGGRDGLGFYRRILRDAPRYLKKSGLLFLEIGFNQVDGVKKIFKLSEKFEIIEIVKDYIGIERVIIAQIKRARLGNRKWTGLL